MTPDIIQFISQVGFPIAVTAYLLTRFEQTIANNTKVLTLIAGKLGCEVNSDGQK